MNDQPVMLVPSLSVVDIAMALAVLATLVAVVLLTVKTFRLALSLHSRTAVALAALLGALASIPLPAGIAYMDAMVSYFFLDSLFSAAAWWLLLTALLSSAAAGSVYAAKRLSLSPALVAVVFVTACLVSILRAPALESAGALMELPDTAGLLLSYTVWPLMWIVVLAVAALAVRRLSVTHLTSAST